MLMHRQQPPGSNLCGQTCVAILTGNHPNHIMIRAFLGKGKTTTAQVRETLKHFGYYLEPLTLCRAFIEFAIDIPQNRPVLARMHWEGIKRHSHWVVVDHEMVYDPTFGFAMGHQTYYSIMRRDHAYFTSYAHVERVS